MISNKIYKKILTVALGTALFSLPLFTACESDVVDLQPIDKFSDLTAYGSPDKPGGLSIQLCKSEKKEFYIRYSS